MALAIDASSPAVKLNPTGNGVASVTTTTTAAFSPPAGSLLLLIACVDTPTATTPTLALSGGTGLTWAQVLNQNSGTGEGGRTVIWTAPNASAQSNITITLTGTGSGSPYSLAMKLWVLTGADTSTPVIAQAGAIMQINGNSTVQQSLTNGTRAGGLLFAAYTDYQCATQTAPTSSDLTVDAAGTLGGTSLDLNYGFGHRTATAASTAYTATWADNTSSGATGTVGAVIIQPSTTTTDSSTLTAVGTASSSLTGAFDTISTSVALTGTATASMATMATHSDTLSASGTATTTVVGGIGRSVTAAAAGSASMVVGHTVIASVTLSAKATAAVAPINATFSTLTALVQGTAALFGVVGTIGSVTFRSGTSGLQFLPAGFAVTAFGNGVFGGTQIPLLVWQWNGTAWVQVSAIKMWTGTAWVTTQVIGF